MSQRNLHELAEARSLELHRIVAERLAEDGGLVPRARQNLRRWRAEGRIHESYAAAWEGLLDGPIDDLRATLVDEGEEARALRQCTPFTFVLAPKERWTLWRRVRARWEAGTVASR